MKTITHDDALRALNEAVKVKGYDFVYDRREGNSCYNVWNGKPDCIVGHALVWLGVPIEWFEEESRANDGAYDVCNALSLDEMFVVGDDALDLFREVQDSQDNQVPWGEAVTRAHLGYDVFMSMGLLADAPR